MAPGAKGGQGEAELREEHVLQLACYIALNGGGEGYLLSLSSLALIHVAVEAGNAPTLLRTLVAKARVPDADIFDLIRRADTEGIDAAAPPIEAAAPSGFSLDDALGD